MILYYLLALQFSFIQHVYCDCSALTLLNSTYGLLSTGDYETVPKRQECKWQIAPEGMMDGQSLIFEFFVMGSEVETDTARIYEGLEEDRSRLIETVDGSAAIPKQRETFYKVRVNSTSALVFTKFDGSWNYDGFMILYYIEGMTINDDEVTCPKNCSNNGVCVNGRCKCNFGYFNGMCSNDDVWRLYQFYQQCNGANWTNQWTFSENSTVYDFYGVTPYSPTLYFSDFDNVVCPNGFTTIPKYVTQLYLPGSKIGYFADFFSDLVFTPIWMDLSNAGMKGRIPPSISKAVNYEILVLKNNDLEGDLEMFRRFTNLQDLDLTNNRFESLLEPDFQFLTPQSLKLDGNSIWCSDDPLPASIIPFTCTRVSLTSITPTFALFNPDVRTTVKITVDNMPKYTNFSCMFGEVRSQRTEKISDTEIICEIPDNRPGQHKVTLAVKNRPITSGSDLLFTYNQPPLECPTGTFPSANNTLCQPCVSGGYCAGSQSMPVAQSGFYQNLKDQSRFTKCFNSEACLGGALNECAKGYIGPLCSQCQSGYYMTGSSTCNECKNSTSTGLAVAFFLISFILLFWALYSVQKIFRFSSTGILLQFLQVSGLFKTFSVAFGTGGQSSEIIGLLNFGMLTHFNIDMFNFDCVFEWDYYQKAMLVLISPFLLPFVLALIALSYYGACKYVWKRENLQELFARFLDATINSYLLCLSILNIPVVSKAIELFTCVETGGYSHLKTRPYIQCYTQRYQSFRGFFLFCAIFYGCGIPLLFFMVLYRHRNQLHEERVRWKFHSIFQSFRTKVWWFQVYKSLWNLLFMLLPSFLAGQQDILILLAQVMLNVQICVLFILKPFRFEHSNRIAPFMFLGLLVSMYSGVYVEWSSQLKIYSLITMILDIFLIIVGIHGILYEYQYVFRAKFAQTRFIGPLMQTKAWSIIFPAYLESTKDAQAFFSAPFLKEEQFIKSSKVDMSTI